MSPITEGSVTEGHLTEVFDRLADVWSGYEPRTGQLELAQNIASVIDAGTTGLFEAGTGTGKTLSYLIPAFLADGQVIVTTGTRHLQDQLFQKDIPILSALFPAKRVALLKGRTNYLCPHRLNRNLKTGLRNLFKSDRHADFMESKLIEVRQWSMRSKTGDLNEFLDLEESGSLIPLVTSTRDNCLGSRCPEFDVCPLYRARHQALEADILVINHHLLFADLAQADDHVRRLLPNAKAVIVDEAHQISETARQFFGQQLSSSHFLELARDVRSEMFLLGNDDPSLLGRVGEFEMTMDRLRTQLLSIEPAAFGRWLQEEAQNLIQDMDLILADLASQLDIVAVRSEGLRLLSERAQRLLDHFALLTEAASDEQEFIHWLEQRDASYVVHLSPVRIANELTPLLSESGAAWIFTSATLSVDDSFSHFTRETGISDEISAVFPSPFDYTANVRGVIPNDLPDPGEETYTTSLVSKCLSLINDNQGRTFFLFTSHRALQVAAQMMVDLDRPVLVQGQQSKQALISSFREKPQSVLLGTQTFWEGVDVRGSDLRLLIIDKLPFPSPVDPLFDGQSKRIREEGGNPFRDLALPRTAMNLKQGFGRLMREASDRGLFVLGDPRVLKKSYGRYMRSNLPEMHWFESMEEARQWLRAL